MSEALEHAGELVAQEAERIWAQDIIDPVSTDTSLNALRCLEVINAITQACNWGEYLGNDVKGPDGKVTQWCAMFAMKAWCDAGGLDRKWLAHFSQSTYRLGRWAQYLPHNEHRNSARPGNPVDRRLYIDLRAKPLHPVKRGDIIIVGDGSPAYGDHVCIAVGAADKHGIVTISGNGRGLDPTGNSQEGVVKKTFYPGPGMGYRAMLLIRPGFGDLAAERG